MPRVSTRTKQVSAGAGEVGAAGAEAVIATLSGVSTTKENGTVQLDAVVQVETVAEDTEVVLRIRRNSLTGTEKEKVTLKPGASTKVVATIQAEDEPGEIVNGSYVVTMESVAKKQTKSIGATMQAAF